MLLFDIATAPPHWKFNFSMLLLHRKEREWYLCIAMRKKREQFQSWWRNKGSKHSDCHQPYVLYLTLKWSHFPMFLRQDYCLIASFTSIAISIDMSRHMEYEKLPRKYAYVAVKGIVIKCNWYKWITTYLWHNSLSPFHLIWYLCQGYQFNYFALPFHPFTTSMSYGLYHSLTSTSLSHSLGFCHSSIAFTWEHSVSNSINF